ncbi:helix-turn-helix transcriptional regulator [Alloprevotella tannerae]
MMKECYHLSPIKTFISKRCHDKEEQIRLLAFFAGSFLALILMSLHVFGFFGIGLPLLQFISWIRLLITLLTIVLYLTKRISLLRAFVSYAIISQVVESIRIICLILLSPTGYEEMLVIHQIGSYTTLLYLALGFVPRASVYVTAMSIGCLVFGGFYGNEAISKQFNILFSLLSITTCVITIISQQRLHDIKQENHDYQTAHRNILQILHITQEELDAYLELCRDRKAQEKGEPKIFGLLDEQKKHNLLEAVSKLQKKYEAEQQDFAMKFPTLSEAEIEVCRYVAEGKTVSEIAIITGKSISNVSTVRGNIRKKIGLARETDLRTFLVRYRGTK